MNEDLYRRRMIELLESISRSIRQIGKCLDKLAYGDPEESEDD